MSDLTLVIGNKNYSSWSLRPWILMRHLGLDFQERLIPLYQPGSEQEIEKHSPSRKVPLLQQGDFRVWDSLAICEYVAEVTGRGWPKYPQARALARSISAEMHSGFPDLRDQLSMDFARELKLPELRPATESQIARILASWENALTLYGGKDGFLFGRFSIADCMYAPVVSRFTTFNVAVSKPVKDYMARIWALPGMQAWLKGAQKEVEDGIA